MNIGVFKKIVDVIEKDISSINEKLNEKYFSYKQILKISKKLNELELKIKKMLTDENTPKELNLKKDNLLNQIKKIQNQIESK